MKDILKPRFVINKTQPEVMALLEKYDNFSSEDYIMTDEDRMCFLIVQELSMWERVVWYAYAEYHSLRKLAKLFGVSVYDSRTTIAALTKKIRTIAQQKKEYI
jgi:hypothetical protein